MAESTWRNQHEQLRLLCNPVLLRLLGAKVLRAACSLLAGSNVSTIDADCDVLRALGILHKSKLYKDNLQCRKVDCANYIRIAPGNPLVLLASGGCFKLAEGMHMLTQPILLPCPATIIGEGRAVLSGGVRVRGWSRWRGGWRSEKVDHLVHALFVQVPVAHNRSFPVPTPMLVLRRLRRSNLVLKQPLLGNRQGFETSSEMCRIAHMSRWLEVVYSVRPWNEPRCAVFSAVPTQSSCFLKMEQPCHRSTFLTAESTRTQGIRLDNVYSVDMMDGTWAQEKSGKIYVHGRNPLKGPVVAARSNGLLLAQNLTLKNIHLELADWDRAGTSFPETQAAWFVRGERTEYVAPLGNVCSMRPAVMAAFAKIERCTFASLGSTAVHLLDGHVIDSSMTDVGGGGIYAGTGQLWGAESPSRVRIARNLVARTGREFAGSSAIWAGYLHGSSLTKNMVLNVPYSGISVGWGWMRYAPCSDTHLWPFDGESTKLREVANQRQIVIPNCSLAGSNFVHSNIVRNFCLLKRDGGGIYMLGPQPNTKVQNNCLGFSAWACSVRMSSAPGDATRGLYNDDGAVGIQALSNIFDKGLKAISKHPAQSAVLDSFVAGCDASGRAHYVKSNHWYSPDAPILPGENDTLVSRKCPHACVKAVPWAASFKFNPLMQAEVAETGPWYHEQKTYMDWLLNSSASHPVHIQDVIESTCASTVRRAGRFDRAGSI